MPDGPEKLEVARAIYAKLMEAELLDRPKWREKDWVKQLLAYLEQS